jgi:shikimate kinase
MRTSRETGAIVPVAPPFGTDKEKAMNATHVQFEVPAAKTRHDAVASGSVLGAMLLSALAGAFVIDVDPSLATTAGLPAHYAAVEEAR